MNLSHMLKQKESNAHIQKFTCIREHLQKKTPLRIVNIELASTDKTWKLDDNVKLSPIAKWCGKKCRPFYKFTCTWWRFLWLLPLSIRCSYSYSWILHRNKTITFNMLWFIPSEFSSAKKNCIVLTEIFPHYIVPFSNFMRDIQFMTAKEWHWMEYPSI